MTVVSKKHEILRQILAFDETYSYSDDHREWKKWFNEEKELTKEVASLSQEDLSWIKIQIHDYSVHKHMLLERLMLNADNLNSKRDESERM